MRYLSDEGLSKTEPAESGSFASPIPTQVVSNGEFTPSPQTEKQKKVEARIKQLADDLGKKHGMNRRQFLSSTAGMAAAFMAMNDVFGPIYSVARAEASSPGVADARASNLANQFIFDCQTHFVRDDYQQEMITGLAQFAKQHWNPGMEGEMNLDRFKFENYIKEIYVDSDTKVAILSGSPVDDDFNRFLTNDQIAAARESVNKSAESRRMLAHSIIQPKMDGWLDDVDYAIETLKPDSWKGYTIGDPLFQTMRQSQWRLDDEELLYPFYEKIAKAGINTICIHKGLMPVDYETSWPGLWEHATVSDVGKAAKDWPGLNFVIYHSALRPFLELPDASLQQFEESGRIDWVTDLAEIPKKFGVTNVYGELGSCFATTSVTHPRLAAAMLGILIKGLGIDKVLWGTDSVWYGSPQWQIEALRRLEMPEDMQKKNDFAPLGAADGPVKTAIFSSNAAILYDFDVNAVIGDISADQISAVKAEYLALNNGRSNLRYGYVHKA
ncbi:MAG: amidohydrolase family protein [Woeseiaceae bacterium]